MSQELNLIAIGIINQLELSKKEEVDRQIDKIRLKVQFLDEGTLGSLAARARGRSISSLDPRISDGRSYLLTLAEEALTEKIRELLE